MQSPRPPPRRMDMSYTFSALASLQSLLSQARYLSLTPNLRKMHFTVLDEADSLEGQTWCIPAVEFSSSSPTPNLPVGKISVPKPVTTVLAIHGWTTVFTVDSLEPTSRNGPTSN
ncbi:hypothetical protein BKA70DRAFT_1428091 [Coprinopsis sp. MPI-PUGE-AT-0042]|nr:hypothetical protein BKA70DRAFT_1428091 [Coprinopsis sp. MPI-PUGE-AT-0042]